MSLEDAAESGPAAFGVARRETVRYHEDLYASATLGQADTWLARPHRILSDALALFTGGRPVVAYDLGAGIGRHTLPMRRDLPDGSRVYAVDLLPSALEMLVASVPPESAPRSRLVQPTWTPSSSKNRPTWCLRSQRSNIWPTCIRSSTCWRGCERHCGPAGIFAPVKSGVQAT